MSLHVPAPIQGLRSLPPDAGEASPAAKLEACHVDFFYGARRALEDVSMPLYEHAVTAIMGPSGCGKSTLLRMFNRMHDLYRDQRAAGRILLDGVDVLNPGIDPNALRARVGMVFQQPAPFPMSIYDNVAFGVRLYEPLSRTGLDARVEQSLRSAALWDEVKDGLRESALGLSGGQQQRLCIARALAVRPEVILFDEPCSALDPHSSAQIEATIGNLKRDHTVAIVTHNLEQAARVSDFVAFMFLGRLVEFGPTTRVFNAPADPRTRDYLRGRFG